MSKYPGDIGLCLTSNLSIHHVSVLWDLCKPSLYKAYLHLYCIIQVSCRLVIFMNIPLHLALSFYQRSEIFKLVWDQNTNELRKAKLGYISYIRFLQFSRQYTAHQLKFLYLLNVISLLCKNYKAFEVPMVALSHRFNSKFITFEMQSLKKCLYMMSKKS